MTLVVFLNVTLTATEAPASIVAGTCCETNSAAVVSVTLGSGVSSPNVPCVGESMRKRRGDGAAKKQLRGLTMKLKVTCWSGATSYGRRTRFPLWLP